MKKYTAIVKRIELIEVEIEADDLKEARWLAERDQYTILRGGEPDTGDMYTELKEIRVKKEN